MQFVKLRFRSGAEHVAHSDRPDPTRHARERDIFRVESAIEKKRKTRAELIDGDAAPGEHFYVRESVRQRVGSLLHRRGTGFADVVAADRDRIPAWHLARGELDHISEKTQRRLDGENGFVLRLNFLKNVGLNCAAQFRNNFRTEPTLCRSNVHGHDDRRRAANGH